MLPPPAARRYGTRVLGAKEDADHVDALDAIPLLEGQLVGRFARTGDAGVVDENVYPSERLRHGGKRLPYLILVRHVEMPCAGNPTGRADLAHHLGRFKVLDVHDRHAGSLASRQTGRPPDPQRSPGHDYHLALDPFHGTSWILLGFERPPPTSVSGPHRQDRRRENRWLSGKDGDRCREILNHQRCSPSLACEAITRRG